MTEHAPEQEQAADVQPAAGPHDGARPMPEGHASNDTPAAPATEPAPSQELVDARRAAQLQVWQADQAALDVVVPTTIRERLRYAQVLADAGLLPAAYRKQPANVLLAMQLGEELGLRQLQALRLLNVVEGTPSLGAEGVRACILAAGHDVWTEEIAYNRHNVPVSATVKGKRRDTEREYVGTFTLDQAVRAGLCAAGRDDEGEVLAVTARSGNGKVLPWEAYTEAMLEARATTTLGRRAFADVLGGLSYTAEELTAPGAVVTPEPPAPPAVPADTTSTPVRPPRPPQGQERGATTLQGLADGTQELRTMDQRAEELAKVLHGFCREELPGDRLCTREADHQGKHAYSATRHAELQRLQAEASALLSEAAATISDAIPPSVAGVVQAAADAGVDLDDAVVVVEDDATPDEVTQAAAAAGMTPADVVDAEVVVEAEADNVVQLHGTADVDPFTAELGQPAEPAPGATATTRSREELWADVEAMAAAEGKSVGQLMMRWTLATRKNPAQASAEELQAWLDSRA